MKAIVIDQFGGVENLHLEELPIPQPESHEVQIQILYASVNPVDWKIREGMLHGRLPHEFPITLGWDGSGLITSVGQDQKKFQIGDQVYVYCRKPTIHDGTYAEYICSSQEYVALKPKNLSFLQSAALPLVGLTAWQALFDIGKLKKGEKILIHAGAGGVGSLAIGLAKNAGAYVYTTARENHHAYVKKLGADVAIDYSRESFVEQIKSREPQGLDLVLDSIGGENLKQSVEILKIDSRLISIHSQLDPKITQEKNIRFHYVFVTPNGDQLEEMRVLFEQGKLQCPEVEELALEDAAQAQEKVRQGHIEGKIVLKIS